MGPRVAAGYVTRHGQWGLPGERLGLTVRRTSPWPGTLVDGWGPGRAVVVTDGPAVWVGVGAPVLVTGDGCDETAGLSG